MSDAEIGARIREARKAAGLSLDDVAGAFGCTRAAVGHWEAGRRGLGADQVVPIAAVVKADPCWLLVGPTSPVEANAHRIRAAAGALATVAGVLDDLLRDQP
jgi:transcriptional regulator with XRE-family HTH domain